MKKLFYYFETKVIPGMILSLPTGYIVDRIGFSKALIIFSTI